MLMIHTESLTSLAAALLTDLSQDIGKDNCDN